MRFQARVFLLLLFLFPHFTALASSKEALSTSPSDITLFDEYRIGVNDILEISVYGEEDLSQQVQVSANGFITYPLLGRLKAGGKSVSELEEAIRTSLAKDYVRDPQVQVAVKEFSNIYVVGQVLDPGPYPFKGGMSVLQAITTAGGFTKIANKRKVRIVRNKEGKPESWSINVSDIINGAEEDLLLEPGDTVIIPESFF